MMNPLENMWILLIPGIAVLIIGEYIRRNSSEENGLRLVLAGLLIAAAGVCLDYFIKTDYEKIRRLFDTCRKAAIEGKPQLVEECIGDPYKDTIHPNKDAMMDSIRSILRSYGFEWIRYKSLTIHSFKNTGHAQISMSVLLDPKRTANQLGGLFFVEVRVELVKDQKGNWTVTESEVISVNNQEINWSSIQHSVP